MKILELEFWRGHQRALGFVAIVIWPGAVVAANQNFMGWAKISKGEFSFNEQLYIDPFLLSGGSLFIIIGLLWLILSNENNRQPDRDL